jgi:tRNA A-37 threonylcarbamoyl transferase component Bud32
MAQLGAVLHIRDEGVTGAGFCPGALRLSDPDLEAAVMAALAEPFRRVRAVVLPDGRRFWLKRVERLAGLLRLQKGDPAKAFATEREGLRELSAAGLPVADLVAEGPGWVLMRDAGPILTEVVADAGRSEADKLAAFAQVGRALGLLHWAGMAHGRPAVRDVCWDGRAARFIDLERFRRAKRAGFWQAADVVMFVQTAFTAWPEDSRWLEAVLGPYAVNAPEGAMAQVRRLAFWLAPLGWLATGLAWCRPESRELRAVGQTLARLRR